MFVIYFYCFLQGIGLHGFSNSNNPFSLKKQPSEEEEEGDLERKESKEEEMRLAIKRQHYNSDEDWDIEGKEFKEEDEKDEEFSYQQIYDHVINFYLNQFLSCYLYIEYISIEI